MADRDAEAVRAHVLSAEVPDAQAQVRLRPAVTCDLELQNGAEQKARWTQGSSQPRPQGEDGRPSLQGGLHHLAGVQRGHSKHPQVSGTPLLITSHLRHRWWQRPFLCLTRTKIRVIRPSRLN